MRISTAGQRIARTAVTRLLAVVALVAVASVLLPRPAFADNDDRRGQEYRRDGGRHDNGSRGRRGPPPRMERYRRYPVYAPPPVYYPRDDSPGIRLVFPIDIH